MNHKLGFYASMIAAICTTLFFLALVFGSLILSFLVCLFLSWAYVLLACAFAQLAKPEKKAVAFGGVALGISYSVFTNLVYFTQLTTVAYQTADRGVLAALTFQPGNWIFGLDLLGYGLMAVSTFLIGLAVETSDKGDKVMKYMLIIHGAFFPQSILLPMLNVIKQSPAGSSPAGAIALMAWCVYFVPAMILSARYFRKRTGHA